MFIGRVSEALSLLALGAAVVAASPGAAQSTGPAQRTKPAEPLGGPAVRMEAPGPTIIGREADGRVKRLDTTPEEAAIAQLALDDETRRKVDAALGARAAAIDAIVRENIDLLLRIRSHVVAGDSMAAADAVLELLERAPALREQRRRGEDLLGVLSPADRAKANRMIRLHRTALFSDMQAIASQTGQSVEDLIRAEYLHAFALELRRSIERQVAFGHERLEEALAAVEATPEQERLIRRAVAAFAEKTQLNPTPEQRRELFREVAAALSPEQVEKLLAFTFGAPEPEEEEALAEPPPG